MQNKVSHRVMNGERLPPAASRARWWRRGLLGLSVLFMLVSELLMFVRGMPTVSNPLPALSQQPGMTERTEPERLLEEARAVWPKALFDDELDKAQNQCQGALRLYRKAGDQAGAARALDELGLIALKRKQVSEALSFFDQALTAARAASDRTREALAMEHLGKAYAAANQRQEALNFDQQALTLYRENKQPRGESRTLIHLGSLHPGLGRSGQGIQYYQQALTAAGRIGDGELLGEALNHLTWTYKRLGDTQQALRYGTQALAAHRQIKDQLGVGYALASLGEIYHETGQFEQAIGSYQQALALADEIKAPALAWKLHARLARAHQEQGQADPARAAYEAAIKIIQSTPAELMKDRFSQTLPTDQQDVFHDYVNFLLLSEHTLMDVERAFVLSEQARAHAFLDLLAEARIQIHGGVDPLKLERERKLLQKLYDLQMALQAPGVAQEERQPLLQQWTPAQQELESFKRDIRNVQPRYAELRSPSIYTVKQIQQELTSDAALLEYLLGREQSYLFVVTPDALTVYALPPVEQVERAIKDYRRLLTQLSDESEMPASGFPLYEMLIQPAQEPLRNKRQLIIVPDGWLHYLPFEALIHRSPESEVGDRRAHVEGLDWSYALGAYAISYAPSASVLAELRRQAADQTLGERLLLLYGDLTSAPASPSGSGHGPAPPPDSESEARAIEPALGERYTDIRLRRQTGDPVLEPAEMNRYRLLHLTVPDVIDESEPWRSGVRLALSSGAPEEAFLRVPAIFDLPLNAQLVTLSHSQLRLNAPVNGRGLMSLTRSFFYAGTPTVLVSLWDVTGPSTGEFMKAFYQQLRAGQSKQAALREAKLQLRQQAPYQHPIYWARFVLIGDGEGTIDVSSTAQIVVVLSAALMAVVLLALGIFLLRTRHES